MTVAHDMSFKAFPRVLDERAAEAAERVAIESADATWTYAELAEKHQAPRPRGPFNVEARRAAGFDEDELAALVRP